MISISMQARRILTTAVVVAALAVVGRSPAAGQQKPTCNIQGFVCNYLKSGAPDPNCIKLPTSLAIANGGDAGNNPGWSANGSACGYNYDTKETCGDNLSQGCCNCDNSGPSSDPCADFPDLCNGADPGTGGGGDPCGGDISDDRGCADGVMSTPSAAVAARLLAVSQVPLASGVVQLLDAFAQVRSIHLVASASLSIGGSGRAGVVPVQSTAGYEYWESGGAYRIHTTVDPALGLVDIPEVAFNGRHHQMMLGTAPVNAVLSVRAGDDRSVPAPLDNPLFLALAFLSPTDSESCPGCELRLSDLRYLARLRAAVPKAAQRENGTVPGGRGYRPGHPAVSHQIELDAGGHVVSIQDLDAAGNRLRQIDLADFQPVAGTSLVLPRSITLTENASSGAARLVVSYRISSLEANQRIAPSTFNLARLSTARKIWSSDLNTYLKYEHVPGETVCSKSRNMSR
jgi:hypothetical protein